MAYTHHQQIVRRNPTGVQAKKAVVMIHGRGSTAESILSLGQHLALGEALLLAPQATNNSWYPFSFMAPTAQNQPALDSAVELVDHAVSEALAEGIAAENIYFVGFSQGACLALEYVGRYAKQYGGIVAFTGGLVGGELDTSNYHDGFGGTPVLITAGDEDPHVPVSRIRESETILSQHGAEVTVEIYPGKPHSISKEEVALANKLVFAG